MAESEVKSVDQVVPGLLAKAAADGIETAWDRTASMKACPIGAAGNCCKNCAMGPCRVPAPKKEGQEQKCGVCGATAGTIAARNFVRMIAAGTASHSDHARGVAEVFIAAAQGKVEGVGIKDEQKLYQLAMDFGVEIGERDVNEIAVELGEKCLAEFGKQGHEALVLTKRAPLKRQELWRELGITPRGVDREVVEAMHRTHMGVDQDPKSLLYHGARCALADGWGGSMIATELQDIMFGTPAPIYSTVNLGVIQKDKVNIVVHGHEPFLAEMIVTVSQEPEMLELAKAKGAEGINICGMCCTANEVLMRHGIPVAGNMLQQELAIVTGAVEVMTVDVQCIMHSLAKVCDCYHTKLLTTSPKAKIPGAEHKEFDEHNPLKSAREIVTMAIDNFPNRKDAVDIPSEHVDLIGGFSHETINYLLGGLFRSSYKPLNDNIINGRIRGVAGVVGCNNTRVTHDSAHLAMVKELIKNDVLVIQTGCSAVACAKEGLMTPEAAAEHAGAGLAEVCETVGIPPVLHMGACVDNTRILMAATAIVKEGGLGDDLSDLPAVGAAPEWMSEKAIAIGQYFVASGVFTVFGVTFPTMGSEECNKILFETMGEEFGGMWAFEPDPIEAAKLMIAQIDKKRAALGIDKARERVLFDMEMRRQLD